MIRYPRKSRPEAEQYFKEAQRLAGSADVPAELQELGKVLQIIMLGAPADLSTPTGELREKIYCSPNYNVQSLVGMNMMNCLVDFNYCSYND